MKKWILFAIVLLIAGLALVPAVFAQGPLNQADSGYGTGPMMRSDFGYTVGPMMRTGFGPGQRMDNAAGQARVRAPIPAMLTRMATVFATTSLTRMATASAITPVLVADKAPASPTRMATVCATTWVWPGRDSLAAAVAG